MAEIKIFKYTLAKDRDYPYAFGARSGVLKLQRGEVCEYFGHTDTYLFNAREGIVPYYDRSFVENNPSLFKPVLEVTA